MTMSLTQITTGGVDENINIDSNTLKVDGTNNRVGIGASSPTNQLHIYDGTAANDQAELKIESYRPGIRFQDRSTSSSSAEIVGDNALLFRVSAPVNDDTALTEQMRIDSTGIGIGTTSVDSPLHVYKQSSDRTARFQRISTQHIDIIQTSGVNKIGASGKTFEIGTSDANNFIFRTNDTERMRLTSDGKLGLGTSNPATALSVEGTSQFSHKYTGASSPVLLGQYNSSGDASLNNQANANLLFATNNTERMRIDSSGNVGINESSPSTLLSLGTSLNTYKIKLYDNGDANDYGFGTQSGTLDYHSGGNHVFYKSGSEKMRLDSAGRFRVPGYGINVAADGSLSFSDYGYSGGGGTDGVLARHNGNAYFSVDDHFRIRDNANNNENKKFDFDTNAGHAGADGNWNSNNFDFAEMLEWSDGNPNAEDRIGYSVAVDGLTGKIKIAEEGDVPIGIVSGTASFVANAGEIQWVGRSKRDEWGRFVYEPAVTVDDEGNEVPLLDDEGNQRTKVAVNPDWDESRYESYVPRSKRPEWACIGVIGQVYMRKNCPVDARWIKLKEIDSVKDLWLVR